MDDSLDSEIRAVLGGCAGLDAWSKIELGPRPEEPRAAELWLQHAAGFVIFKDAWEYAVAKIPAGLSSEARTAALQAVDDAVYGMMMIADGVSGSMHNDAHEVRVRLRAELLHYDDAKTDELIESLDLFDGDGVCMGFHFWREGDFGSSPVAAPRQN
jgi:hypothetical protein